MASKLILDISIGKKLQGFRKQKGFSQMEVVREANLYGSLISESTYSKIEQGTRNIYASDLVILKKVLGFRYEDLFGEFEQQLTEAAK